MTDIAVPYFHARPAADPGCVACARRAGDAGLAGVPASATVAPETVAGRPTAAPRDDEAIGRRGSTAAYVGGAASATRRPAAGVGAAVAATVEASCPARGSVGAGSAHVDLEALAGCD